jgi:hypothetical protein
MSEPENFVARWSRRKREAAQDADATKSSPAAPPDADSPPATNDAGKSERTSAERGELPELPFDLASLPPVESITAESDIRAFLAPGVPPELARAALRRVWTADPAIRDFVGLAENAWDFNAPGSMAGFGSLEMTEELRGQVMRMVGRSLDETADLASAPPAAQGPAPAPSSPTESDATVPETGPNEAKGKAESEAQDESAGFQDQTMKTETEQDHRDRIADRDLAHTATHHDPAKPDNVQVVSRPLHGRALPK